MGQLRTANNRRNRAIRHTAARIRAANAEGATSKDAGQAKAKGVATAKAVS